MFTQKKTQLIKAKAKPAKKSSGFTSGGKSAFSQAANKKSAEIRSGNNAVKFKTTGDSFVDQFGKLGAYKAPRSFSEIEKDVDILWSEDPLNAVKFNLYLRTIPRKVQLFDGSTTEEPQKGAELKHEPIFRMIWLSQKSPETFWKNIGLFVSLGSWHDIFTMLQYDLIYNAWEGRKLDWQKFGNLILTALETKSTVDLVKKYLPQIKANSDCKTVESQANNIIAKWICSLLFGSKESSFNYKQYRKLKSSGQAHEWQKLISTKQFNRIDFDKIHGRALSLLVRSKFLKNQGLSDKYAKWVVKPETKVKYTGFVHELLAPVRRGMEEYEKTTVNKQFATLVEKAKSERTEDMTNFIVVRDTSGSMSSPCTGTNTSCFNVGKALALYFSEFLTGKFADSFIEFNSDAKLHTWKGSTPVDKWLNDNCGFYGSTNFESVVKLFAKLKKEGLEESEFPTGILCISDSEFNPASLGQTNVDSARQILRNAGFSKHFADSFVIVLWNLQSGYYGSTTGQKFETNGPVKNVHYFSGFSPSVISFVTNTKVETARDVFDAAMNQEILRLVEL